MKYVNVRKYGSMSLHGCFIQTVSLCRRFVVNHRTNPVSGGSCNLAVVGTIAIPFWLTKSTTNVELHLLTAELYPRHF